MNALENKTILLTGGTGSFGNKFAEIVLKKHKPKAIRIFSRGEKKQYEITNKEIWWYYRNKGIRW